MNERQKKVMGDAFTALSAAAHKGKRLVDSNAPAAEVQRHLFSLDGLIAEMKKSLTLAMGAENVIDIATKARAKTLSSSRRS